MAYQWNSILFFGQKIGDLLLDSLNEGLLAGELSTTQKQTFIKLIGKPNKDKMQIKSWRPLNLINFDVKSLTKTLALRVGPFLQELITQIKRLM